MGIVATLVILVSILFLIIGGIYIQAGIKPFVKRRKDIEHIDKIEYDQEILIQKQVKR